MSSSTTLHSAVVDARIRLTEGRAKAREQHDSGAAGLQVCFRWTDIVDGVLESLIQAAVGGRTDILPPSDYAFVAHSGYGRRDLAPFSDVDVMLLYRGSNEELVAPLARSFAQMVVDAGLQPGFSMRTSRQAHKLAWQDATIFSALVESRLLSGNAELFERFQESFRTSARRRSQRMVQAVNEARLEERQKYGETVFLLHPNVKRSRGCLRDIQLVRWIGFACYGESDPEQLLQMGLLLPEDYKALRKGYQYLLRLRNQLHFDAGRSQDSLDRHQQVRLASWAGFQGHDGLLPVEEFMQEYFERTSEVLYSSSHFVDSSRVGSPTAIAFARLVSRPLTSDFRLGLREIWATKRGMQKLQEPAKVLELMTLANQYNRRIEHQTWRTIRTAMLRREPAPVDQESIMRFLALMEHSRQLGRMLRRLHELGVLEQIIPSMKHARYLLQFNEYHKYTVDAHSIRSVEMATDFANHDTLLGETYRSIKNKRLLHLALLLHDLGKGFVEDHSDVGARLADETAMQLRLSDTERELLVFLIQQHLLMAHTAFRYDLSEHGTVVQFAGQVGSHERLQLLFVLTCADIAAVGPGILNDWKLNLLIQLYESTAAQFGDQKSDNRFQQELKKRREAILKTVAKDSDAEWIQTQVESVPIAYLFQSEPAEIASELRRLKKLTPKKSVDAWGVYKAANNAVQYSVAVKQDAPIGLFHEVTGALSSQGLEILSAEIHTQQGEIAWDRFVVEDPDFDGPPPLARIESVCEKILEAIDPQSNVEPTFRRVWKPRANVEKAVRNQPTQVRFDNSTSDRFTIISVFAYDRTGLLYDIAKSLFEAQLVLHLAKISTHLDQVVDVFYVTDLEGQKVSIPTRLYTLRQSLLKAIE
ncbi:MAG: [protein-PII] uridylyltransferase [Pirellulaceae bacterium]|nr:[protein-PII] uridylyltransferase [Pirellulaceae bacterium]